MTKSWLAGSSDIAHSHDRLPYPRDVDMDAGIEAMRTGIARLIPAHTNEQARRHGSRFSGTMAALHGSKRVRADLRFVVFDVPYLLGADLRGLTWQERRERLELVARAFDVPLKLSPLVEPSVALVEQTADGRLESIVLKDGMSTYRDGSRAGWTKVKDRSWYEREAWRFDRR